MRFLLKSGSTITDYSKDVKRYADGSATIASLTASTDKIYIGQAWPFNHLYFEFTGVNADTSVITAKIYDGDEFQATVETIDETLSSGATFGQSGFITWQPDRDKPRWAYDDTDEMTELSSVTIYDMYWLELSFSANLTSGFTLKYVGNMFSTDNELYEEYEIFNRSNVKTALGVSTYKNFAIRASELTVSELKKKNVINHRGQILDRDSLILANVSKTAELIFSQMGDDYIDDVVKARNNFRDRIHNGLFGIDKTRDADLNRVERVKRQGFASR